MSKFGEVRFVTCTDPDDARQTLEALFTQKSRSLARRGIPDIFEQPGFKEFFFDLTSETNLRHQFHVSRIEVGGTVVAANFAIIFGDCYYHVLASYDDTAAIAHFGPGALHLRELLAYAIGRDLRRFDFTIGDEAYKLEWSDCSLELFDYSAAATWRGLPSNLSSQARRRTKRFIKQTPTVWRWVSFARSKLGARTHGGGGKPESPANNRDPAAGRH
jgi:CelD/BcsL family acetyltransferase involved in cellulose biosynthesis